MDSKSVAGLGLARKKMCATEFANKYPVEGFAFMPGQIDSGILPDGALVNQHEFVSDEVRLALMEAYRHPIHREIEMKARQVGGHGGMDAVSAKYNSMPVAVPDFTRGDWNKLQGLKFAYK